MPKLCGYLNCCSKLVHFFERWKVREFTERIDYFLNWSSFYKAWFLHDAIEWCSLWVYHTNDIITVIIDCCKTTVFVSDYFIVPVPLLLPFHSIRWYSVSITDICMNNWNCFIMVLSRFQFDGREHEIERGQI